jgi:predicted nucleic acid-binding protein
VTLVDTSVWVDHIRNGDAELSQMLIDGDVLTHPLVIEELACGNLPRRDEFLRSLAALPSAAGATHDEILTFIETHGLHTKGLGAVDVHVLASVMLTRSKLWTRDKSLAREAKMLAIG